MAYLQPSVALALGVFGINGAAGNGVQLATTGRLQKPTKWRLLVAAFFMRPCLPNQALAKNVA